MFSKRGELAFGVGGADDPAGCLRPLDVKADLTDEGEST